MKGTAQHILSVKNKPYGFLTILLTSIMLFTGCEDVVEVEVNNISPRLVVEADIEWEKGEDASNQSITLSTSTDFFDGSFLPVNNADVSITKLDTDEVIPFTLAGNGVYATTNFIAELGSPYQLTINYDGEDFVGYETFVLVPEVNRVVQDVALGFEGEDVVSIDFFADDVANMDNFFLLTHAVNGDPTPFLSVWDDNFQNGNELRFFYRDYFDDDQEVVVAGDEIAIEFMGISESYYDFMFLLTEQAYSGGDPFDTTPVQLKGNVTNMSNPDQDAFGFFRLSEKVSFTVVVQ